MIILVDTNIALDFLTMRQPFYNDARKIVVCIKVYWRSIFSTASILFRSQLLATQSLNKDKPLLTSTGNKNKIRE